MPRDEGQQQCVLAEREGTLAQLVNRYKFGPKRSTYRLCARLFDDNAPDYPTSAIFVPLSTSPAHQRQRRFDHMTDTTRRFARLRNRKYRQVLERRHNHAQVGATRATRRKQALSAYQLKRHEAIDKDALYVLCDDIVTTGYSMVGAIRTLRKAGVRHIAVLALMQQPWQK